MFADINAKRVVMDGGNACPVSKSDPNCGGWVPATMIFPVINGHT